MRDAMTCLALPGGWWVGGSDGNRDDIDAGAGADTCAGSGCRARGLSEMCGR